MAQSEQTSIVPVNGSTDLVNNGVEHDSVPVVAIAEELELQILQSFIAWSSSKCVHSYSVMKSVPFLSGLLSTAESIAGKTGITYLTESLFATFLKCGGPLTESIDKAMGQRIVQAFIFLLETSSHVDVVREKFHPHSNEEDQKAEYAEQQLLAFQSKLQLLETSQEELEDLRQMVTEYQQKTTENENKILEMKDKMVELQKEKDKISQELTDVHNFSESSSGQMLLAMEAELAETKIKKAELEGENKKLQIELEKSKKRKLKKSMSKLPDTPTSVRSSTTPRSERMSDLN